jgi:hypothetical protein
VEYAANRKAWMVSSLFENWLRHIDRRMAVQGRKIILFIDNCPAHPKIQDLKAIKLVYFLPNTTSVLQPCDQEIIWSNKSHYRRQLMQRMINHIDSATPSDFSVSLLDALQMLGSAWMEVTSQCIRNCFTKAGLKVDSEL